VTRRTTHAFWRKQSGEWLVTPLSAPTGWQHAQSSSKPLSNLRFGDFTGDGVTDVLAVDGGQWAISPGAHGSWEPLNSYHLSNDVRSLLIADLDHNNIDDLILLEAVKCDTAVAAFSIHCQGAANVKWWVSYDGRSPWRELTTQWLPVDPLAPRLTGVFGYAGRFGAAPGGGVLLIGRDRFGHFFSEAEIAAGASPDWMSVFPY
jgi:hypothetical protein